MAEPIIRERMAADDSSSVVVFIIGMRINRLFPPQRWLEVARSMPKMLAELRASPTLGLLHAEGARIGLRTFLFLQYWKSFDALEAYARNPDQTHWPAWREFNRKIGTDGSVGIFHETYLVPPTHREAIYVNMPSFGLGAAVGVARATSDISKAGTYRLGDRSVNRMGYGAMQLAGPGVFGPPRDHEQAIAVLKEAVGSGVNHIDTSDYYGPYVTNEIIREALAPYADDLVLVTKLGARRGNDASWLPWNRPEELAQGLRDNLERLGLEVMEIVNLRIMGAIHGPAEGPIADQFEVMADLQRQGLVRHLGLSNVTSRQIEEAQAIAPIVCVQNMYNLVYREDDDLIDQLAQQGIAYVPFFPLGGFTPLQSQELDEVASDLDATPMQVALAWLLQRSPNILLIPGTASLEHLRENLAAADLNLSEEVLERLEGITTAPR